MAYYAHQPQKFHGVHPPAPVSPMPSYQSSSQSETTSHSSPGGTIGSNSYATPSWATPSTPHSYYSAKNSVGSGVPKPPSNGSPTGGMIVVTPPSPGFSECSDEYNYDDTRPRKSIREVRANTRALSLLDSTAGSDVRVRAFSESHVEGRVNSSTAEQHQRLKHYHSKKQANLRANMLLNETVGGDVKATAVSIPSNVVPGDDAAHGDTQGVSETVKDLKRSKDKYKERGANMRALALLHETVGNEVNAEARMASNPIHKKQSSKALRQALIDKYKKEQKAKAKAPEMPTPEPKPNVAQQFVIARPTVEPPEGQEQLAESSRKFVKAAENFRDPETVAGMKCDLEIEREERAKSRALRMMKYGKIA